MTCSMKSYLLYFEMYAIGSRGFGLIEISILRFDVGLIKRIDQGQI